MEIYIYWKKLKNGAWQVMERQGKTALIQETSFRGSLEGERIHILKNLATAGKTTSFKTRCGYDRGPGLLKKLDAFLDS